MNRFAHLLDRLAFEHARNAKLRLMADYFRTVPDPERGWAFAAMAVFWLVMIIGVVQNFLAGPG